MTSEDSDLFGRLLAGVVGAEERESAFGHLQAIFVDGREIAHLDAEGTIDIRMTHAEIRRMRSALRADPRVVLRRSSSADWLEVVLSSPDDEIFVTGLLRIAAGAHRRS